MICYKAFELAAIEAGGYMGLNDYALKRIANELKYVDMDEIGDREFTQACLKCGIDPKLINKTHISKIEELLNRK